MPASAIHSIVCPISYFVMVETGGVTRKIERLRLLVTEWRVRNAGLVLVFASRISTAVLTLLTSVIVARSLGAEGRGAYALVLVTVGLLQLLATLGLSFSSIFHIGQRLIPAGRTFIIVVVVSLGASLLLTLAFQLTLPWLLNRVYDGVSGSGLVAGSMGVPGAVIAVNLNGVNLARAKYGQYSAISICHAAVNFVLCILLLQVWDGGVLAAVWAWSAGATFAGILAVKLTSRGLDVRSGIETASVLGGAAAMVRYGIRGQTGNIVQFLNYRIDQLIIGTWLGPVAAGYYAVAVTIGEAVRLAPDALNSILLSKVSARSTDAAQALVLRAFIVVLTYSLGATAILALIGEKVISTLFGKDFVVASAAVVYIALGMGLLLSASTFAMYLTGHGRVGLTTWANMLSLCVTILLDVILIPMYGIIGAAVASALAYTAGALFLATAFCRVTGRSFKVLISGAIAPFFRISRK